MKWHLCLLSAIMLPLTQIPWPNQSMNIPSSSFSLKFAIICISIGSFLYDDYILILVHWIISYKLSAVLLSSTKIGSDEPFFSTCNSNWKKLIYWRNEQETVSSSRTVALECDLDFMPILIISSVRQNQFHGWVNTNETFVYVFFLYDCLQHITDICRLNERNGPNANQMSPMKHFLLRHNKFITFTNINAAAGTSPPFSIVSSTAA